MLNGFNSTTPDYDVAKDFFLANKSDRIPVIIKINTQKQQTLLIRLRRSKFKNEKEYLSPLNLFLEVLSCNTVDEVFTIETQISNISQIKQFIDPTTLK